MTNVVFWYLLKFYNNLIFFYIYTLLVKEILWDFQIGLFLDINYKVVEIESTYEWYDIDEIMVQFFIVCTIIQQLKFWLAHDTLFLNAHSNLLCKGWKVIELVDMQLVLNFVHLI